VEAVVKDWWDVTLRGGSYEGIELVWQGRADELESILIVWTCDSECPGHGTFQRDKPEIVLARAESYRRVEFDEAERTALYESADGTEPVVDREAERVLEYAGAVGLGSGWPVSP
jgi:hypothetical protein